MNRRDIDLLSAYLDGELKPSDSIKLEARLNSDLELASVLNDLRAARTLLRKLPARKAPRNFTLTRKMVGQNPPMPRTYPIFRLATAVATLMLFFSFGLNFVGAQLASQVPAFGMGGGGGEVESFAAQEAPAMQEPAAAAPVEPPAPAPAGTESGEPSVALVPPTEEARVMETPAEKSAEDENAIGQDQSQVTEDALQSRETQTRAPLVPSVWQIGLAVVAIIGLVLLGLMRQLSARHWK